MAPDLKRYGTTFFVILFSILYFFLFLASCRTAPPHNRSGSRPERIVSLAPNITEIVFALGAGDRIVGVTQYCTYPAEAILKTKVGGFSDPNPELIIFLKPDLIIATPNVGNRDAVLWLKKHSAIPVPVVKTESLPDLYDAIRIIGNAINEEEQASLLAENIRSRIELTRTKTLALGRKRVLLALSIDPVIAASPDSYPGALATLASADLVPPGVEHGRKTSPYTILSIEEIIQFNPDVIIQTTMDSADQAHSSLLLDSWKKWKTISAVKNGKVLVVPGDLILRPSPRAPDGLNLLVKLIHE